VIRWPTGLLRFFNEPTLLPPLLKARSDHTFSSVGPRGSRLHAAIPSGDELHLAEAFLLLGACHWTCDSQLLRAALKGPVPEQLSEFAGGDSDWFGSIFPRDQERVRRHLAGVAGNLDRPALDYRLVTEKFGIVWIRHWIRRFGAGASVAESAEMTGLVQIIDERKALEAECLMASEREKTTLGQELHDDVCQILAGMSCMLQVIGQEMKTVRPAAAISISYLMAQLQEGMIRTRSLAHGLVPARLVDLGINLALEELATATQVSTKVTVSTRFGRQIPPHQPEHVLHLYRIAQEAMGNAVKHGKATKIDLGLRRHGNHMRLAIRDNGCGVPAQAVRVQGLGLHNMNYRASVIGGKFSIAPRPVGGTVVTVDYSLAA